MELDIAQWLEKTRTEWTEGAPYRDTKPAVAPAVTTCSFELSSLISRSADIALPLP
jgi:hypothetical protein